MCHPMETIYLRTRVKSKALKYAILDGALIINLSPEECEERLQVNETDVETIKKDIQQLEFELTDLKLKISKKFVKF